ncbi:MAG: hypothetical protein KatS3mg058_0377 [Roseiflexus sp.]|nr:MAG: hypothetical protein KatS3mg058_0377 [Roseiflexus sp.]
MRELPSLLRHIQGRTARMSIAGRHGVGMRRFSFTPCPSPAQERGDRRPVCGRPPVGVPVFAVIARPAQQVEAIPPLNPRAGEGQPTPRSARA